MQLTANGSQHHFARGQTLGDGGLSVRKKTHCTFRPAGFCLGRKNRSFCPPVAKTSDSCPLTRYVVDLFNDFLLMESHFFQKPHFYGLYPAKNRSSCPEATKMNDSSQFTKENARFSRDRPKRASFALCIAAHLGSYRSSNLNGAAEAWCDGSSVVSSGRRRPSSSRRAEGRLRCRPSSRGRPSRCPEGSPPGACCAACTARARAWRTA